MLALKANSTLAFTCRPKTGYKTKFSLHSYGRAIDINTRVNPYVKGKIILPPSGHAYLDRTQKRMGMIVKGDIVYRTFIKWGWHWGGNWKTLKDYMHFEK